MDRILLVDDDRELCQLLSEYLVPEGFEVIPVNDGLEGLEMSLSGEYSLIVLDVMLPGMTGLEILKRIRSLLNVPILMLTARGEDVDRIVGLEMGADDYLPKPFNPRELVARIRAILRRSGERPGGAPQLIAVGDIEMDIGGRIVRRAGRPLELTSLEFSLLEALLRAAGHVVTRDYLAEKVLGRSLSAYDRSVDVHLSSLRKKLGHKRGDVERIKAVRGIGYIYTTPSIQRSLQENE
ncbi:MAG: response regulator transcription factor [Syntrophobacteraceae bacterium]